MGAVHRSILAILLGFYAGVTRCNGLILDLHEIFGFVHVLDILPSLAQNTRLPQTKPKQGSSHLAGGSQSRHGGRVEEPAYYAWTTVVCVDCDLVHSRFDSNSMRSPSGFKPPIRQAQSFPP